jgi:hypothetical protein
MRNALPHLGAGLGASDIESAIDLDRIEVDDLAAGRFREAKSELGLSDSRRPRNDDDHMRSLTTAGHVRALVFARENVAQVLAAVDRSLRDLRLADLAAIPHHDL